MCRPRVLIICFYVHGKEVLKYIAGVGQGKTGCTTFKYVQMTRGYRLSSVFTMACAERYAYNFKSTASQAQKELIVDIRKKEAKMHI